MSTIQRQIAKMLKPVKKEKYDYELELPSGKKTKYDESSLLLLLGYRMTIKELRSLARKGGNDKIKLTLIDNFK